MSICETRLYQSRTHRRQGYGGQARRTSLVKLLAPVLTGFVLGFGTGLITYCWVHIISQTRLRSATPWQASQTIIQKGEQTNANHDH